jgi:predicted PurR-regulated permease PerM
MATNRIIPPAPEQLRPQEVPDAQKDAKQLRRQEERELGRALRAGAVAQVMVALAAALVICYFGKLVLVTLMVSILITFMLEPIVALLERIRVPRSLGALLAVLLLMAALYGVSYFFYSRAISFAHELPRYSHKIQGMMSHITKKTSELEKTTQQVLPKGQTQGQKPIPVNVENGASSGLISQNIGTVTETVLTLFFIPFLVYFMLSWREHARTKTVQLFKPEYRSTAYVTMGQISLMMKSFIAGNFVIGLFISIGSVVVFGVLGLPYFYFIGFISGFLSLMPYLGVLLALIPPLTAGVGSLSSTGIIIICATVLGLHVFSMNVLYPKILGKRLQLNPMVVTIALLIWGFIWGAMGLILAVPIMGAIKIICDHVNSLRPIGQWLGD